MEMVALLILSFVFWRLHFGETSALSKNFILAFSRNLENNWGFFENSADFVSLKVVVPFYRFPFW